MEREQRIERVKLNDERLTAMEELNPLLEAVPGTLEEAWGTMKALIEYYTKDWLKDYEELEAGPDGQYGVLSEDGVWNEMGTFYHAMQDIAETATRILAEYEADQGERVSPGGRLVVARGSSASLKSRGE